MKYYICNTLKTTKLFLLFLIGLNFSLKSQKSCNAFKNLQADSVIMYDFGGILEDNITSIVENNKVSSSVTKKVKLNKKNIYKISKLLYAKKSYGGISSLCFEPHLGLVYYKANQIIGYINVCFICNRLYSTLPMNEKLQSKERQGEMQYYIIDGMGEYLKQELNNLLIKNNFSHTLKL